MALLRKPKFFKRGHQYWKINTNGQALLINTDEYNKHYDGDAHIFMRENEFLQDGAISITEEEFNAARDWHISRLKFF